MFWLDVRICPPLFIGRICLNIRYIEVMQKLYTHNDGKGKVRRVRVMSSSNYNMSVFIVAMKRIGQIKWPTDSKVIPTKSQLLCFL